MSTVEQQIDQTGWVPFQAGRSVTQHLVREGQTRTLCGLQDTLTGDPVAPDLPANPNWNRCGRCTRIERHAEWEAAHREEDRFRQSLVYVNTYQVTRFYGGPEEGGWWYDRGVAISSVRTRTADAAQVLQDELLAAVLHDRGPGYRTRYSAAPTNGSDIEVYREPRPAADFPTETPRYE